MWPKVSCEIPVSRAPPDKDPGGHPLASRKKLQFCFFKRRPLLILYRWLIIKKEKEEDRLETLFKSFLREVK